MTRKDSSPVINDKVGEDELMWVEQERRNTKRKNRDPEVDEVRSPERQRHVEQHYQRPHPEIYTWPSKPREQNAEVNSRRCKTTPSSNVTCTSKR